MGNPNIAALGASYRFKPGSVRRRRNGVKQVVVSEMDNALSIALEEALKIILDPRNKYHKEYRVEMIQTIIKYCSPKRKEIDLETNGGLLGFDPTKFFSPDAKPEPTVEAEYTESKAAQRAVEVLAKVKTKVNGNGNGNGNGRYADEDEDD